MAQEKLDRAGRGKLHYAAINGDLRDAVRLIQAGADVNLRDENGDTPLHFAAQQGQVEVAKVLLDNGANIDDKNEDGNTPLLRAVAYYRGDGKMIELLRSRGADPLTKNEFGISPVEGARRIVNYDAAKFFEDLPK